MSNKIIYHVAGRFEGEFKTLQDLALKSGDPFPEGSKHLIRIYRGTISNNHSTTEDEFQQFVGEINGSQVNNIQINANENWPIENDRIFSLSEFKLSNSSISVVHSLNGQTYGKISGDIAASVSDSTYKEALEPDKIEQKPWERWSIWNNERTNNERTNNERTNNERTNNERTNNDSGTFNHSNSSDTDNYFYNNVSWFNWFKGLMSKGGGCLKWLLWLILFLILLYWFFNVTEFGIQLVCRFENWKLKRELAEVQKERKELEETIQKTRPKASQCGVREVFKGTNQQQNFTYTLGQVSGKVLIAYNMFQIPDRMEVMFNGKLVAETNDNEITNPEFKYLENKGFADLSDTLEFDYKYKKNELHELTIRIIPNQDAETTEWQFNVICP
jgi:hypothetical protein